VDGGRGVNIHDAKKEDIIATIEKSGCDMLKDKLEGDETKDEIVAYLHKCKCPALSKKYSGLKPYSE